MLLFVHHKNSMDLYIHIKKNWGGQKVFLNKILHTLMVPRQGYVGQACWPAINLMTGGQSRVEFAIEFEPILNKIGNICTTI